jgi:long-chain acyl-CoA synthetase
VSATNPSAVAPAVAEPLENVAAIVRRHAAERPDRPALVMGDDGRTWGRLGDRAARVANALIAAGVGPQDRVAFCDRNGLEYFDLTYGAAMANAVVVALNWRLAPPEMEAVLNDSGAKVLVVGPDFFGAIEAIAPNLTTVTRIVAVGEHARWIGFEDWIAEQPPADPHVPTQPGDVCMQLYTSGTTGLPKGVMITNANFLTLIANVVEDWNFDGDSVDLVAMPLFHIGGCGWAIVGMYLGGSSVVVRDFVPDQILDLLERHRITNALLVPAMLAAVTSVPGAADRDYSSLRSIAYGASPITTTTLVASMRTFRCRHRQVYGMTETTGVVTRLAPEDHDPEGPRRHLLQSAGRPYPWVELRIVDLETARACGPGEVGEVVCRSGQNMLGYWNKPDETARTVDAEGWLHTGDAGYLDDEGYLFLTDRVKDMIVSGGENVYPTEVENALATHPAVAEVAVIGVPHDRWGETVKAVVVARPGETVTAPQLMAYAKERLAGYKCPTSIEFAEALPRNPSGKVLKKDLRAPYWEGRSRNVN